MHKYNKKYTRDYYVEGETSSSEEDDYITPLAKDMSKTDRQIAELLYNLNHIDDKPEPKSKISDAVKKKRAANLAKAREVRMKKLKEKKEKEEAGEIIEEEEEGPAVDMDDMDDKEPQLPPASPRGSSAGLKKPKNKGIKARGDDDPYASKESNNNNNNNKQSYKANGLKIPPPDAPMPGDDAVMPVYF